MVGIKSHYWIQRHWIKSIKEYTGNIDLSFI